ncbi:hypothetical protein [Deinococcus aquaedulcis]|uniref:hypothetical protein n=1 Tax=Deinococcus aquaedulcis TaxID=2840455 RepID=UPI001C83C726|nr:hypothetical protein [Deinococcus aquaedulcis]
MTTQPAITNITRTWQLDLYGSWGDGSSASVFLGRRIVSLSADAQGRRTGTVDGKPTSAEEVTSMLNWARDEGHYKLLDEVRPTIGKARAAALHKVMGILGLKRPDHYALCAQALNETQPRASLAELTEADVQVVWAHLCAEHPEAKGLGVRFAVGAAGKHAA